MEDFRMVIDIGLDPELLSEVTDSRLDRDYSPQRFSSELQDLLDLREIPVQLAMPWPEFGGGNVDG